MRNCFPDPTNPTRPTIDMMSFFCQTAVLASNPQGNTPKDLVKQVSACRQHGHEGVLIGSIHHQPDYRGELWILTCIGQIDIVLIFSFIQLMQTCAYAWAINVFLTGLYEKEGGCNAVCTEM
jgi:hypothetical protein